MHFEDMVKAIALIQSFVEGVNLIQYSADSKTRSAVERQLQILTEAAHRIDAEGEGLCPELPWSEIRDMGNFLRHAYHKIDDQIVWNTVSKDLPAVKLAVERALASFGGSAA